MTYKELVNEIDIYYNINSPNKQTLEDMLIKKALTSGSEYNLNNEQEISDARCRRGALRLARICCLQ